MKKILYITVVALMTSCSGFLEEYSQDLVVPKSITDLNETILGSGYIPSHELEENSTGSLEWFLNFLDDDINTIRTQRASGGISVMNNAYFGYTTWQLEVGRSYNAQGLIDDNLLWNDLYARINAANTLIHEAKEMIKLNPLEEKEGNTLIGESYFLRAQLYFLLVNLYGDAYAPSSADKKLGVPLKISHYVELGQFKRNTIKEVYDQIIFDLKESIEYFENGVETNVIYRASKEASQLLLSRVYLYTQSWEMATDVAMDMLESKKTLTNLMNVQIDTASYAISANSVELIFSQGTLNLQGKLNGEAAGFCVSRDLYNLYEDDDMRKDIYYSVSGDKDSVALNRKYRTDFHVSRVSDAYTLRVAEAYLNAAEGAALSGDEALANKYLHELKGNRIKNYLAKNYSGESLISEIRDERRRELAFEGHRWFDLRRYAVNTDYPYSKTLVRNFTVYDDDDNLKFVQCDTYELMPMDLAYTFSIPIKVLELDTDLEQNERELREPVSTDSKLL